MTPILVLAGLFVLTFAAGKAVGLLLAREWRLYREVTRRGGVVDLAGARPRARQ